MILPLIAFLAHCGLALIASAAAADAKPSVRNQVEELIRQLDADSLVERSRAERSLLDMGPEVLKYLPPPDLIENVPAREAVFRLRPLLERRAARESSAASRVTLAGEKGIGEIVEQIEAQTRNRLSITGEIKDAKLHVDWQQTPFWQCVDELCQKSGYQWQFVRDESSIQFSANREHRSPPIQTRIVGPFRIDIEKAELKEVFGDATQKLLRITGRIVIEPRLRPLFFMMAAKDFYTNVDERHSLSMINPEAKYEFPVADAGRDMQFQWDFQYPADLELDEVAVRGRLNCQVAAATERVVFDQKSLKVGTIRRRGGVTVKLRRVTFEPQADHRLNAEVGVAVSYDTGFRVFESHRSWMFHNAVYMETKTGERTSFTDFETTQQDDGLIAVDYRWATLEPPGDRYLFVYEAPSLFIDVPIEVDVKGIRINKAK